MVSEFSAFVETLRDFVNSLLPSGLSGPIMLVVGIVLALAAWRIVS